MINLLTSILSFGVVASLAPRSESGKDKLDRLVNEGFLPRLRASILRQSALIGLTAVVAAWLSALIFNRPADSGVGFLIRLLPQRADHFWLGAVLALAAYIPVLIFDWSLCSWPSRQAINELNYQCASEESYVPRAIADVRLVQQLDGAALDSDHQASFIKAAADYINAEATPETDDARDFESWLDGWSACPRKRARLTRLLDRHFGLSPTRAALVAVLMLLGMWLLCASTVSILY